MKYITPRRTIGPTLVPALLLLLPLTAGWAQDASDAESVLRAELAAVQDRILFERYENNNWELYVMNADGSNPQNLTQTPTLHEMYPQASRDGARICFLQDELRDGETVRSVYYMNADGTGRTLVAENARQPCWSPDGSRIAFVKNEFSRFRITDYASKGLFFYDLKTGAITEHPNQEIMHLYTLNWTADGRWIISTIHAGMGFKHGILALPVDGMGVYTLGIPGCRPCPSNDGARITWSSDDHTINSADLDLSSDPPKASNIRVVEKQTELHTYHPDFSPDGKYITFSIGPGGRIQAAGPGTHADIAEAVGVAGHWDLYLKRSDGLGPAIALTHDASLCNKESEWIPAPKENTP